MNHFTKLLSFHRVMMKKRLGSVHLGHVPAYLGPVTHLESAHQVMVKKKRLESAHLGPVASSQMMMALNHSRRLYATDASYDLLSLFKNRSFEVRLNEHYLECDKILINRDEPPIFDMVALKHVQCLHAQAVVMGFDGDNEVVRKLRVMYNSVTSPAVEVLVQEGKVDEAVKLVLQMREFGVTITLCEPIIRACANSNPVDVETVRKLFGIKEINLRTIHFVNSDVYDKLTDAGFVWPLQVLPIRAID